MDQEQQRRQLSGKTPLITGRPSFEGAGFQAGIPKIEKENLSMKDFNSYKFKAETGLEYKFRHVEYTFSQDGSSTPTKESLEKVYEVGVHIEEFEMSLKQFDMHDVFIIPNTFELVADDAGAGYWQPSAGASGVDLFTSHADVDEDTVRKASEHFLYFEPSYMVKNLIWSTCKLHYSCEEDWRIRTKATVKDYPVYH